MRKSDSIRLAFYILAVCAALTYPVKKILSFEYPAVPPKLYLFETEIRDPYDPMRGRYVQLNFKQNQVRLPNKNIRLMEWRSGNKCFAVLEKNPEGTPRISDLVTDVKQVPAGKDFLQVRYSHFQCDYDTKKHTPLNTGFHVIVLPFDRFYLNESLAPEAEQAVRENTRKGKAYARIKVYENGSFAMDDLIVDGQPILERLRGKTAK